MYDQAIKSVCLSRNKRPEKLSKRKKRQIQKKSNQTSRNLKYKLNGSD